MGTGRAAGCPGVSFHGGPDVAWAGHGARGDGGGAWTTAVVPARTCFTVVQLMPSSARVPPPPRLQSC